MSEFYEYSKIENHIKFSKKLFALDRKGHNIISELNAKKFIRKTKFGRPVLSDDLAKIHAMLTDVINHRRFTLRLYFCLQYYLDDLLFREVASLHKFYDQDEEHELTQLYFNQDWIRDISIDHYEFKKGTTLELKEALVFISYLREYEDFLTELEDYLKDIDDSCPIPKKISKIIGRIRHKQKCIWDIVTPVIEQNIV